MKPSSILLITVFIMLQTYAGVSLGAQSSCPEHFVDGSAPELINQKLSSITRDLCYSGFALKHSGITRSPLFSAEHLTRDRLAQAKGMKRSSKFFPDPNIPTSERAELHHYARSGYDRGHVAPSGDMPSPESQQECFTLANMVPQVPSVNRGIWEGVESATRKLAKDLGDLYIVTGPIYSGNDVQQIGGAVMVPTQMFKAIYDPKRQEAGAYIVGNAEGAQAQVISIAELEKISGINVFPSQHSCQKECNEITSAKGTKATRRTVMAKNSVFKPFKNESDCIQIGEDLTIENRLDRISIFGSVEITLDKPGLNVAKELMALLELTIEEMGKTDLPNKVTIVASETVKNPFS